MADVHKVANGAPLGLLGFGLTTVLLNLHNAGLLPMSIVILSMGLAMGGFAQIIVGVMEFVAGNVFGATAFTAYGAFWWSLVIIVWNPLGATPADGATMGWYLLLWGLFSLGMFIGTLKHARSLQFVFGTLVLLFFGLSIADFSGSAVVTQVAGWIGIVCGLSAIYCTLGQILNHEYGKKVVPL